MASTSTSEVCVASSTAVVDAQRSSVPPGVRVTWSQRRDKVIVAVEFPSDSEEPQVSFSDCGLVTVHAVTVAGGAHWDVRLQCSHKIDAAQSRCPGPHHPRTGTSVRPGMCMCRGPAFELGRRRRVRRWMATERSVRLVLHKLAVARWDRLVTGEKLASRRVESKWHWGRSERRRLRGAPRICSVGLCAGRPKAAPAHVGERDGRSVPHGSPLAAFVL